jgi:heme oxygenase
MKPDLLRAGSGLRTALRFATTSQHQALDALAEGFDLDTIPGYAAFLGAHASILPALENAITADPLPAGWPAPQRTPALFEDIHALGETPPPQPDIPKLVSLEMRVGALYVLEGSRLGGAFILRRINARHPEAPTAFLAEKTHGLSWPRFVTWLDGLAFDPLGQSEAIDGARRTFAAFENAFRMRLPPGR